MPRHRRTLLAVLTVLATVAVPLAAHGVAAAGQTDTATCSRSYLPLPDPDCTPGALDQDVTQATISRTICVAGWTATIRPPMSYTNRLKTQGIAAYGYRDTNRADYEEDHFLPLELGGSPDSPENLWPEPHTGSANSYDKDAVENAVKKAVCAHETTLHAAQHAMLTDWTTAESVLGID